MKKSSFFYLSILISLIPLVIISGPFLPDLIVVLSSLVVILLYFKNIHLKFFNLIYFKFYFIWCFYFFIISLFSDYKLLSLESSLFYFRFGFLVLLIMYLLNNFKEFKFYFFISMFISFSLLIFDSFFQYILGYNMIGLVFDYYRLSSFFGDELILGTYIVKMLPLFFALSLNYIKYDKKYFFLFYFFYLISLTLLILLSGERTSLFLYLLYLFMVVILFNYNLIKKIIFLLLILTFIGASIFYNTGIKNRLVNLTLIQVDSFYDFVPITHEPLYQTAINIFLKNKLIGTGPKTFREICKKNEFYSKIDRSNDIDISGCSTHPHNTYLQLLSETGVIGTLPVLFLFLFTSFILLKHLIIKLLYAKLTLNNYQILIYSSIFINLFPLAPSMNFFNNRWSLFLYLPLAFIIHSHLKDNNDQTLTK